MRILTGLIAVTGLIAAQPDAHPHALATRAKDLVLQPAGRLEAESLLKQAVSLWEKQGAKSDDYAEALDLLAMALNPALAKDKAALEAQVEPLARKALELRQQNANTRNSDLALALEIEALVLEELGRVEESREPKSKARALRDQIIIAMQPPAEETMTNSTHMGAGVNPPQLMARDEPHMTFAASVLKLQPEVLTEVIIGTDGVIHQIEIFRPAGFGLDENAVAALMQWRFKPAEKNGKPVPVEGNLKLRFLP